MGVITTGTDTSTHKYLLKAGLNKLFDNTIGKAKSEYPYVTNDLTTKDKIIDDLQMAGLDQASDVNEGEDIPIQKFVVGNEKRYTQSGMGTGFRITHQMDYFNNLGLVKRMTQQLAKVQVTSKDVKIATMFNAPTATESICGAGFDSTGTDLAEDTHYGALGSSGDSYDNYLNAELSVSSVQSARYYFETMTDDRGNWMGAVPSVLAYQPTLHFTVKEIFGSELKAHEMSNTVNVLSEMDLTLFEYHRLTGTKAWFMEAKNDSNFDINVYTSMKPIIRTFPAPDNTLDTVVVSLQYFDFGFGDARCYYCGDTGS